MLEKDDYFEHFVVSRKIHRHVKSVEGENFAQTLNELMWDKRMTQQALAKATGLSTGAISQYRNGRAEPKVYAIVKIAQALDVDCNMLLTGVHAQNRDVSRDYGLSGKAMAFLENMIAAQKGEYIPARISKEIEFEAETDSEEAILQDYKDEAKAALAGLNLILSSEQPEVLLSLIASYLLAKNDGTTYRIEQQYDTGEKSNTFGRTLNYSEVVISYFLSEIKKELGRIRADTTHTYSLNW